MRWSSTASRSKCRRSRSPRSSRGRRWAWSSCSRVPAGSPTDPAPTSPLRPARRRSPSRRRARAEDLSISPTHTGAAKATSLVIPEVKGKIDVISLRVPTPDVSVVELTAEVEKKTTIQEVNDAFKQAARSSLQGILDVSDEPLVSVDYIGSFYSSVVDALSTNVIDGTFLHLSSWYDNEMGYSARCVDLLAYLAGK